ncbi:MAG: hypothetical protein COX57_02415 [Alphaproteobacteria bacterium CG_4_10_14_0_2_um_filter_63_37]|nr:MAG: hypothetical protein COX57_02415 [Alphaproteobacteria bacterium CG_4_10_14_0_2_um_filter_63_37]
MAEVERCIDTLARHPKQSPVVHREVRRAVVRHFPYAIFYRLEERRLIVLAVFHGHRDPAIWQRRL